MGRMENVLEHPAWLDEVLSRWQEVVDDKNLEDLPYKIETNRSGDKEGRVTFHDQSGEIEKSSYGIEVPPFK